MNFRVERLYTPVEHLGKAGVIGDLGDREARLLQKPGRAAGRDQAHAVCHEPAREIDQPGLVGNAEQCLLDYGHRGKS